jgi:hypothetical protein
VRDDSGGGVHRGAGYEVRAAGFMRSASKVPQPGLLRRGFVARGRLCHTPHPTSPTRGEVNREIPRFLPRPAKAGYAGRVAQNDKKGAGGFTPTVILPRRGGGYCGRMPMRPCRCNPEGAVRSESKYRSAIPGGVE